MSTLISRTGIEVCGHALTAPIFDQRLGAGVAALGNPVPPTRKLLQLQGVVRTESGGRLSGSRPARGAAIVVATNRDMYVGRLDVKAAGGKVVNFSWEAIPVNDPDTPLIFGSTMQQFAPDPCPSNSLGLSRRGGLFVSFRPRACENAKTES